MLSNLQLALAVAVVAAITYACRLAPFALLRGRSNTPLLSFLSRTMPLGVMIALVAYTLNGTTLTPSSWLPPLAGVLATAATHLWRRHVALSLVTGTAVYTALSLLMR